MQTMFKMQTLLLNMHWVKSIKFLPGGIIKVRCTRSATGEDIKKILKEFPSQRPIFSKELPKSLISSK